MILRVTSTQIAGPSHLSLEFSNGARGMVDVSPLLRGEVFEALKDPAFFERGSLDPELGTVTWPNGADFAPEALHDLMLIQNFKAPSADAELRSLLDSVRLAARRYQELTGRPLGVTGEVAEIEAIQKLGLVPAPVRQAGYDALRLGPRGIQRIQVKGRRMDDLNGRRMGPLRLNDSWDSVILVVLDLNFSATAIYEADRPALEESLTQDASGAEIRPHVRKFMSISRQVWPSQEQPG